MHAAFANFPGKCSTYSNFPGKLIRLLIVAGLLFAFAVENILAVVFKLFDPICVSVNTFCVDLHT